MSDRNNQTPLLLKVLKWIWIAWLVFGVFILNSCEGERNYLLHPVTSDEADAHDAMHTR
jgi:hypothetical protein